MPTSSSPVRAAQQGVEPDWQQLGSIDLWCQLAAYLGGRIGFGQRCCQPVNADSLGGRLQLLPISLLLVLPFALYIAKRTLRIEGPYLALLGASTALLMVSGLLTVGTLALGVEAESMLFRTLASLGQILALALGFLLTCAARPLKALAAAVIAALALGGCIVFIFTALSYAT